MACCSDNSVAPYDEDRSDCIFLGLEGAGKTLTVRRLQSGCCSWSGLYDRDRGKSFQPNTWPTTGVEISIVKTAAEGALKHARTRELGGCMAPIWPNYYEDADSLAYIIDLTTPDAWAAAAAQLKEIVTHRNMMGKPVLILLNKCDKVKVDPNIIVEMEKALGWDELAGICKAGIAMQVVSALTGQNLEGLLQWLLKTKVDNQAKILRGKP